MLFVSFFAVRAVVVEYLLSFNKSKSSGGKYEITKRVRIVVVSLKKKQKI